MSDFYIFVEGPYVAYVDRWTPFDEPLGCNESIRIFFFFD